MDMYDAPQAPSIVSRDAADALPRAQRAFTLLREAMREYPPIYRTDEFDALQQVIMEMIGDLQTLVGEDGAA